MNLIESAKLYINYFNWSVIPVKPNSKIAAVEWKKYQKELITLSEVDSLFASESNIALVTGELSGIIVIDLDEYKKKGGTDIYSPLSSLTPREGRHLFFRYEKPVSNSVNADMAIDVRGEGGYVLLPPSMVDGRSYRWNTEPTKQLIDSLPVISLKVLKILQNKQSTNDTFQKFDLGSAIGTSTGGRNDILLRASESLLNGINESEWQTKGIAAIRGVNNTFSPPLPEYEVFTIYKQASNFIRNNPKQSMVKQQAAVAVTSSGWKPQSFAEVIAEVKKRRKRGEAKGIESGYESVDKITNGFKPGESYLFFGDTNTGKSCLLLNFLLRMARMDNPVTYFDLENNALMTTERMALIYDDYLQKDEWERIKGTDEADIYMDKLAALPFHLEDATSLNNRFSAITYEAVETVIREQAQKGCKVFGIDHLHYFEPSGKNYGYLQDIAKKLNDLAGELNISILLIAHTRKGLLQQKDGRTQVHRPTTDDISGSGLISRHTKNVIGLMRNAAAEDPSERRRTYLFFDKTKTGNIGTLELRFHTENLHFEEDGDDFTKTLREIKTQKIKETLPEQDALQIPENNPEVQTTALQNQKHRERLRKLNIHPEELRGMRLLYYWKEAIVLHSDLNKEQINSIVRWLANHTLADIKKEI